MADKIAANIPVHILNDEISHELFERDYTTIGEEIRTYKKAQTERSKARISRTKAIKKNQLKKKIKQSGLKVEKDW